MAAVRIELEKMGGRILRKWLVGGCAVGLLLGTGLRASTPPENPLLRQAAELVEWGRWKEARALVTPALAPGGAYAANPQVMGYYAHLLLAFGDLDEATQWAEKAVKLDDSCARCHLYLFETMARHAKGMSQMRALLYLPKIKKELERATALAPTDGDVQWGWIDLDLGLPAAVGGSASEAAKHADTLSREDPLDGWLARAEIAETQGKSDLALQDYEHASRDFPDDPRGDFALGKALYERGDYSAAETPLRQAAQSTQDSALYSGYWAAELTRLNRLEEARTELAAGAKSHPDSRLGDFLVAQALQASHKDSPWAHALLESYLAVPSEPEQPTAGEARQLEATLG